MGFDGPSGNGGGGGSGLSVLATGDYDLAADEEVNITSPVEARDVHLIPTVQPRRDNSMPVERFNVAHGTSHRTVYLSIELRWNTFTNAWDVWISSASAEPKPIRWAIWRLSES